MSFVISKQKTVALSLKRLSTSKQQTHSHNKCRMFFVSQHLMQPVGYIDHVTKYIYIFICTCILLYIAVHYASVRVF